MKVTVDIAAKTIEVRDCQYCPHHFCFFDGGWLDCSCDLGGTTQTSGVPNTCPLLKHPDCPRKIKSKEKNSRLGGDADALGKR